MRASKGRAQQNAAPQRVSPSRAPVRALPIPPGRNIPTGPHKRRPQGTPDAHAFHALSAGSSPPCPSGRQRPRCRTLSQRLSTRRYAYRQLSAFSSTTPHLWGPLSAGPIAQWRRTASPPRRPGPCRCVLPVLPCVVNSSSSPLKACMAAQPAEMRTRGVLHRCELAGAEGADEAGDERGADETVLCGFDDEDAMWAPRARPPAFLLRGML
jgi:hypothetical protein